VFVLALAGIITGIVTEEQLVAAINGAAALAVSGLATLNTSVKKATGDE
jgi:hypothetical protein